MSPLKFPFFRKKKDLPPPHSIPHRQDFYSFQQQHHHSIAPLQLITPLHCQCQLCSPTQPVPMPQYPYHHQQPWFQPIQPQFVPLTAAAGATAVANAAANGINNINNTANNNNNNNNNSNNTSANSNITTAQFQQPYQCACQGVLTSILLRTTVTLASLHHNSYRTPTSPTLGSPSTSSTFPNYVKTSPTNQSCNHVMQMLNLSANRHTPITYTKSLFIATRKP